MWNRTCALLGVAAAVSLAGKPGGGGGPPPDPAVAYVENSDLKVMNADGSSQTMIVAGAGSLAQPAWSPDGSRIAFNQGGTALCVVNRDASGLTTVFEDAAHGPFFPAWSPAPAPDGKQKIAFNRVVENEDGTYSNEIWLVNPDGTGLQNLTSSPDRSETYPAWSPEAGRLAVFYQDLETQPDGTRAVVARGLIVFHLTLGTGEPVEIAAIDVVVSGGPGAPTLSELDWARAGDQIAYASGGDIFVLDLSSPSSPLQLTFTAALDEYSPSWSPDDTYLVFERKGSGKLARQSGVHVMRADGSGVTSLGAKDGRTPDWRR